jgi:thiamine-phosphate pyrophosphorylase
MLSYAITDASTLNFASLEEDLQRFAKRADMILYRDKQNAQYAVDAKRFVQEAKRHAFDKILLHNDLTLADSLKADGVHFSSDNIEKISLAKQRGLFVILSTHTLEEAKRAEALGTDMITFSPVFETPGKGAPVGLKKLSEIVSSVSIPVIALGGIISIEQIKACENAGAAGFASIRYFK